MYVKMYGSVGLKAAENVDCITPLLVVHLQENFGTASTVKNMPCDHHIWHSEWLNLVHSTLPANCDACKYLMVSGKNV